MKNSLCLILTFLCCSHIVFGQVEALGLQTRSLTVKSEILGQERELIVYSPNFANGESRKLPSVYLLDGKENFLLTVGVLSNLIRADVIPPVNIIGIDNYNYDRLFDLTPKATKEKELEGSGGAERFLDFLEKEVTVEIDKLLPQSSFKVLIGHSLGGLFSTFSLVNKPDLFKSHISVGGNYWYDGGATVDKVDSLVNENKSLLADSRLYFSLSDETDSKSGFDKLESLLRSAGEEIRFDRFEYTDHVTGLVPSLLMGLQHVFSEWKEWDNLYAEIDFDAIKKRAHDLSELFDMDVKPRTVELASFARGKTRQEEYAQAIEILEYLEKYSPEHIMVLNYWGKHGK